MSEGVGVSLVRCAVLYVLCLLASLALVFCLQMKKADESTLLGQMFALKPGTDTMLMEVHNS